jgi:hypothetical protein
LLCHGIAIHHEINPFATKWLFPSQRGRYRLGMSILRLTRRWLLCGALALAALASLGGFLWWVGGQGRVTKANYDRIRFAVRQLPDGRPSTRFHGGSSYEEVVAILGPPTDGLNDDPAHGALCSWLGFDGAVVVAFAQNRAVGGQFTPRTSASKARWLWRRLFHQQPPF